MSTNPYESPMTPGGGYGGPPNFNAAEKTNLPGLFLMIFSGIWMALMVVGVLFNLLGGGLAAAGAGNGADAGGAVVSMAAGLVGNIIFLLLSAVVFFGGMKMRNLESYGLSMAAAIIACIPCCSPCYILGIPFGIWALVVLNDAQVKAAFRG
jgi:hypothetical protein